MADHNLTQEQLAGLEFLAQLKAATAGGVPVGGRAVSPKTPKSFRVPMGARGLKASAQKALPSGTPEGPYMHGPNGVFGIGYSLQQDILSTRMVPRGLLSELPWYPSVDENPIFGFLTGWTSPNYTPPDEPCDPPSAAGNPKTCTISYPFGRYTHRTRELEVNRINRFINRGEARDLRFVNDPLSGDIAKIIGLPNADSILNGREFLARMVDVGIELQNELAVQTYTGDPANNNAGGGYLEFTGLDLSITDDNSDFLVPGTTCPSLGAIIADFNFDKITDSAADTVGLFSAIMNEIENRIESMQYVVDLENREEFSIEMARRLFWALTTIWPCAYMTNGCADGVPDPEAQITMRDAMRNGKYLWINGKKIPVVIDDGITETAGPSGDIDADCFASNVYFTTRRVNGGHEVLYVEYADYEETVAQIVNDMHYFNFWSDNGIGLWTAVPNLVYCVAAVLKVEPRLINKVPYLDGKILNMQYCPDARVSNRHPIPGQPGYVNGGVSTGYPDPFPPLAILSCNPPDGQDDVVYAGYTFVATGGTPTYTWGAMNLPPGLSLNASTGALTGTPTTAGTYVVTVTVFDSGTPALIANCQTTIVIAEAVIP